ncbi:MAG: sulfurtransferase [Gammaproteobacteria bacterium]
MSTDQLPLIISPESLRKSLADDPSSAESLLLIAVCSKEVFNTHHLPGSQLIEPAELVSGEKPATGKIPTEEQLSQVFSRVGLDSGKHVIAYDDEGGGWAGRLIWTLEVLGHNKASYLDGGLVAWVKAGLPVTDASHEIEPSDYKARIDRSLIAQLDEVKDQLGDPETVVWDARAREEYEGRKVTARRNGHIPGAVNLNWLHLMDPDNDLRLRPLEEIQAQLHSLGIDSNKQVITHCQTHHRSGLTWLVGKALGINIRAYDGSWSEWGNRDDTPIDSVSAEGQ